MRPFTERDARSAAALVSAFVASRIAWLIWNPGSASYWEESYRWIAVDLWREGVLDSFFDLQADHYQGGSLVMIALARAAFAALGPSELALKLVAVGYSALTLGVLFETLRRFFGRPAATIAAAAYAVGPPLTAYWSLAVMGSHSESVLWSLLQIGVFLGILSGEWRGPRGFFAFGALCGLALWFCFTAGIATLACALTWLVLERRPPRARELGGALLGAAIGLLPWLAYNLRNRFAGTGRVLEVFGLRPQIDPWPAQGLLEKLGDLLTHVLPVTLLDPSFGFDPQGGLPLVLSLVFAGVSIPALLAMAERIASALRPGSRRSEAERARARLELVFLVYPAVFLAVYLASRFAVAEPSPLAYRLFAPFGAMLCVPVALTLADFIQAGGRAAFAGRIACAVWLVAMSVATARFALRESEGAPELGVKQGYRTFGVLLNRKNAPEVAPSLEVARRILDPASSDLVRFGIGWGLQNRHEMGGPLSEVETALATARPEERDDLIAGLRWALEMRPTSLRMLRNRRDSPLVRAQLERTEAMASYLEAQAEPAPRSRPSR